MVKSIMLMLAERKRKEIIIRIFSLVSILSCIRIYYQDNCKSTFWRNRHSEGYCHTFCIVAPQFYQVPYLYAWYSVVQVCDGDTWYILLECVLLGSGLLVRSLKTEDIRREFQEESKQIADTIFLLWGCKPRSKNGTSTVGQPECGGQVEYIEDMLLKGGELWFVYVLFFIFLICVMSEVIAIKLIKRIPVVKTMVGM